MLKNQMSIGTDSGTMYFERSSQAGLAGLVSPTTKNITKADKQNFLSSTVMNGSSSR
jgi:hypothetical protein